MGVVVQLLGTPSITIDGVPAALPRGRKSWGLLAFLTLTSPPPSRRQLASLLFSDADDPLRALRWCLTELRRSLAGHADIAGDPVTIDGRPSLRFDVLTLDTEPVAAPGSAGELLEGMHFDGCDAFEAWLVVERRRLSFAWEALIHERALRSLASGRAIEAAQLAADLVSRNELDENFHALLIRSLAASGQRGAAKECAVRCAELFRRELGVDPSPAIAAAAETLPGSTTRMPIRGRVAALAQLDAGRAAISAGAADAGVECLRLAVAECRDGDDRSLLTEALLELGAALLHAVRGGDEEASLVLHEALVTADDDEATRRLQTKACRELAFADVLAGRHDRATRWIDDAEQLAGDDPAALASILGVRGMVLSDAARYPEAERSLRQSIDLARDEGLRFDLASSLSLLGRVALLRGELADARDLLDESLELARAERWTAYQPWPEALRGDAAMLDGEMGQARSLYEHAFALACQIGDPCWEGLAARGMGMCVLADGDGSAACDWFVDARARCTRWPDAYQWVHAYVLDAFCDAAALDVGPASGLPSTDAVAELTMLASRTGLSELVVRAHVHDAKRGSAGAAEAARLAVAGIDNPRLAALVAAVAP